MAIVKEGPTLELMWNIIRGRTEGISKVTFFPQKPDFPEQIPYEQPLPRSTPEKEGVSSSRIREMIDALAQKKTLHLHSVMVLKNGKVIGEASFIHIRQSYGTPHIPWEKVWYLWQSDF